MTVIENDNFQIIPLVNVWKRSSYIFNTFSYKLLFLFEHSLELGHAPEMTHNYSFSHFFLFTSSYHGTTKKGG